MTQNEYIRFLEDKVRKLEEEKENLNDLLEDIVYNEKIEGVAITR